MRWLGIFAIAFLLAAAGERADAQPANPAAETLQAANELFAMLSKDMLAQMTSQTTAQVWPYVERELGGKVDADGLAQLRAEFERIQLNNLSELMKDAPAIYARHFTAA